MRSLSLLAGTTVGEYILISNLPGKHLRTLVELRGLPYKLDIKISQPGNIFVSLPIGLRFKPAIMT